MASKTVIFEKYVNKIIEKAKDKNILLIDIDGTIVDSSKRFKLGKDYYEIEELMDKYEDKPKNKIIKKIKELVKQNYYPIFVTGRRRSLKTNKQLKNLGFNEYYFLRNSKFYNPTLSSKFMKENIIEIISKLKNKNKLKKNIIFIEDRPDILMSIADILKRNSIEFKKEFIDNVFFFYF